MEVPWFGEQRRNVAGRHAHERWRITEGLMRESIGKSTEGENEREDREEEREKEKGREGEKGLHVSPDGVSR